MKMRWVTVLAVSLMVSPCFAQGADAAKQVKAEKLIELMHMDTLMRQVVDSVKLQMHQSMAQVANQTAQTPKQKAVQADFDKRLIDLIASYMSWEVMKPDMVKVYADTLTNEEMDGMIAFYGSPVGQAVLQKMPQITGESMNLARTRMAGLEPKVKALMDDYAVQMKAASN